jgi:arylsulfatase A-like enzyme
MKQHIQSILILLFFIGLFGCRQSQKDKSKDIKRPNILLILVDDLGYSDLGCYGSDIKTPSLDKLAHQGVIFSDFYVSSLCAPTRAMLLTGVDNHQNGLGTMPPGHTENQYLQPGYEGSLNNQVVALPEIMRDNGYHTYMSGKWHLGHHEENYPANRGFEKSFAFLGGGSGHFSNAFALGPGEEPVTFYVRNKNIVEKLPDDFYSTKNFTDEMIHYILEQEDDSPFFAYLAYTAPHDPLHVPDEYLDKYTGVYDAGYEQIKKDRLGRMKKLGIVDESIPYNPGTGKFPQWEDLDDNEKKTQARKMEIFAAMIENLDHHIGRVIDTLKKTGKYENTIFIFLSDNGANPKEAVFYPGNSKEFLAENFDNSYANLGKSNSFISQGGAWAEVSNTPFTYFKTTTGEGGIHAPLIISGPNVKIRNLASNTGMHVCDIFPTVLDFAGVSRPDNYNGNELAPLYGFSAMKFLAGDNVQVRNTTINPLLFEMIECRAIIKGKWKAMMLQAPYANEPIWQLYDLSIDPLEKNDLALQEPEKLEELIKDWDEYANDVGYIKAEGEFLINKIGPEEFYKYESRSK